MDEKTVFNERNATFRVAVESMATDGLYIVLDDIQKRIGDGFLSDNAAYLADQKEKAEIVASELKKRAVGP